VYPFIVGVFDNMVVASSSDSDVDFSCSIDISQSLTIRFDIEPIDADCCVTGGYIGTVTHDALGS
jgi:hypothetical protein